MQPGDAITFTYQDKEFKGVLLTERDGHLTVKLSSGYNMVVKRDEIDGIKAEPAHKQQAAAQRHIKQDPALPKVTILHTGGTIASKIDYKTGAVAAQTTPDELLALYPELHDLANIDAKLVSNIFSEDMNFGHYNLLAREIQAAVAAGASGVIVTHGTDTMHYTSAAMSFMLQDLGVPVLFVGSQRSSDRGSSDASTNLIAAMRFVTKTEYAGVAICMQNTAGDCHILQGLKARKMHSSRRDAFRAVNTIPLAVIGKEIAFASPEYPRRKHTTVKVHPMNEDVKVGMLYVHPNLKASEVLRFEGYDGLLILGLGIGGHVPINVTDGLTAENGSIAAAFRELGKRTVLATATQTIYGRVNMNVYSTGRHMQELGIVGHNHDMHPETAFIKLAWLLSNHTKEEAKELFAKDLCGEISSRSPVEDDREA